MKIALWKLGSLEHKIFPTVAAIEKFKYILENHLKLKEESHIVWGPDVDVQIINVNNLDEINTESDLVKILISQNKLHIIQGLERSS